MKRIVFVLMLLFLIFSGAFVFTACNDSDLPEEQIPEIEKDTLEIVANAKQAYLGETITFTATLEGNDVTTETTFYKDNIKIEGNSLTSHIADSFAIQAKNPKAADSKYITVTFTENLSQEIKGVGILIYNENEYALTGASLKFMGYYYTNEDRTKAEGLWQQTLWDTESETTAKNIVMVSFYTPAIIAPDGENIKELIAPDQNQNRLKSIVEIVVDGQDIINEEYTGGTGVITYNSLNTTIAPGMADFEIEISGGDYPLTASYQGQILAMNAPEISAKNVNIKSYAQLKADQAAFAKKLLRK